jgi:preprotein translocase subunit SecA
MSSGRRVFPKNIKIHYLNQLLREYSLYNKNEKYAILDNKIMITDGNIGKIMQGRLWSDD